MSLYETLNSLPDGKRLKYENGGITVLYEITVRPAGSLDVRIITQRILNTGAPDIQSEIFEGVDHDWCDRQEQELRKLGIDSTNHSIIKWRHELHASGTSG